MRPGHSAPLTCASRSVSLVLHALVITSACLAFPAFVAVLYAADRHAARAEPERETTPEDVRLAA